MLPIFWPQREAWSWNGTPDITSAPPASVIDASPSIMVRAALMIASTPEPHRRLSVSAGVSCGTPALSPITRAR